MAGARKVASRGDLTLIFDFDCLFSMGDWIACELDKYRILKRKYDCFIINAIFLETTQPPLNENDHVADPK